MATVRPFRALRPAAAAAVRVAAPPYDVVNTAEARALAAGNPDSYLRISRPEIDLPEGTDEHDDRVYAQGAKNLAEFVKRGVLRQDAEPHLYVYAQRMGEHRQTGLVACASVAEYLSDAIKKHEKTRPDKEDDRTRHIDTLGAHDEPVFLTYRAVKEIDAAVAEVARGGPFSGRCRRSTSPTGTTGRRRRRGSTPSARGSRGSTACSWRWSSPTTRCRSSPTTGWCATRSGAPPNSSSRRWAR
jgi:hypothetical protein